MQKIPPCDYRENVEKWFSFISKVTTEKESVSSKKLTRSEL